MRIRQNGSIQPSNTPTPSNTMMAQDFNLYRAMVTRVIYVDDAANITTNAQNPRVLYDVILLGGFASGQIISNCRMSSSLGGNNSYEEKILKAASKKTSDVALQKNDGDIVLIQFLQGNPNFPIIVGMDLGITPNFDPATKSDGPRFVWEYNGVNILINNDGELVITRKGGTLNSVSGEFIPDDSENVEITIADNQIKLSTQAGMILNLKDNKVAVGTSSVELLDTLSQLVGAMVTETHLGNLGYSTSPPQNASTYTQLKAKIDQIKGTV